MKIYVGASVTHKFKLFGWLIKKYAGKPYSHIYTRYQDPFTKQEIISESSHGEAHKILLSKWYIDNRIVEEYAIDCSEESFRAILSRINTRLQASYSISNIIGIPIYDLGAFLKSSIIMKIANLFKDGAASTICSESASFTLELFGVKFNRPKDFVRPDHVIEKLAKLSKSEEYINKVII